MFRSIIFLVSGIFFGGLIIQDAYAYIDPGSATMFIQVIVGVLVGVGITIKIYWEKIKFKLFSKINNSKNKE